MYVKASYNIKFIDFSFLSPVSWIDCLALFCGIACVYIGSNINQLSMNGDLEAKKKTQTFPPLHSHVYIFEPFSVY